MNLLLIVLVFMLSISAVSAFEPAVADDVETSDSEEEPPSGSLLNDTGIKSVSLDDYSLETKDFSMYYKNGSRYEIALMQGDNPLKNSSVIINIGGVNYTRVTDDNGMASIAVNLNPGKYSVTTYYNYNLNAISLNSSLEVLPTLMGEDLVKFYRNGTKYQTLCLDGNGNPLINENITFNINGVFYTRKTNESGIASLNINLNSGEYIITAIHKNGLMQSNNIKVLPSLNGSDVVKFYKNDTHYYATFFDSQGNPLANENVTFNINGVFYQRVTDNNGISRLNINLIPNNYILTAIHPVNGEMFSNNVTVLPTLIALDVASENKSTCFDVILLKNDGNISANANMTIKVDDTVYNVTTDDNGMACLELNLSRGIHSVLSTDLDTGCTLSNTINITYTGDVQYYSEYGVSPDGETLMAIGRPSASGELSAYGYTFYMTTFERVCPYCGSTELYWSIFWADTENGNWGVFPATGYKESGSAEGQIFCAECDADWSIFGNNHASGKALTILSKSVLSSKEDAYLLKNGEMIYS